MKYILKKDAFRKSRGGHSRLLALFCGKCKNILCKYQKDGPGPLKRLYLDRVISLETVWKKNKKFICKNCYRWLGMAGIYEKEKRKCFILFQDQVIKKIIKK